MQPRYKKECNKVLITLYLHQFVLAWVGHREIQNMVPVCKKVTVCLTKVL